MQLAPFLQSGSWSDTPPTISPEDIFPDELPDYDPIENSLNVSEEQIIAYQSVKGNSRFFNPLLKTSRPTVAKYMRDTAGNYLFAPGVVHWVYGPPGSRKSFLCQTAILNHSGVYIDAETNPIKVEMRTKLMGYDENSAHRFSCPETMDSLKSLVHQVATFAPTIVVLDSSARLCALLGLDPLIAKDIQVMFDEVIRPLANAGHAVVVIDHLPKNGKNKDFAFGSMDKKAQADVLILVEAVEGQGHSTLTLQKDRMYTFGSRGIMVGQEFALLKLNPTPLRAIVEPLTGFDASGTPVPNKREQKLKETKDRIVKILQIHSSLSKSDLNYHVGGKSETATKARQELIDEGIIVINRGKTVHGGTADLVKLTGKRWEFNRGSHLDDLRQ